MKTLKEAIPEESKSRVHGYRCNLTESKDRQLMLRDVGEKFGRLDVLVLNHAVITHNGR
jgi:NAD(P)-dependent dehydrogenase (short-subunit alcohol dehydrogenase family)